MWLEYRMHVTQANPWRRAYHPSLPLPPDKSRFPFTSTVGKAQVAGLGIAGDGHVIDRHHHTDRVALVIPWGQESRHPVLHAEHGISRLRGDTTG